MIGQTGGLPSPGCGMGGMGQHTSPSATGASLLMPMKKVMNGDDEMKKNKLIIRLLNGNQKALPRKEGRILQS